MCFDRLQLSEQIRQDGHDETGFLNLQHPVHLVHPVKNPGGLDPWNIAEAIKVTSAKAVDVASGVESVPGTKDQHRIKKFVAKALDAMSV